MTVKISDLPQANLPLAGTEELELEASGISVRAAVSDISAALGLGASFVTVTPNAILPNERILTAGTNISIVDAGPGGAITINSTGLTFPILAPDGTVLAPSYSFASTPSTGLYIPSGTSLGVAVNGNPDWEFNQFNSGTFRGQGAGEPGMRAVAASGIGAVIHPNADDTNTGLGWQANDQMALIAGGVQVALVSATPFNQFKIAQSGSSSVPELTSLADDDTGFRWPGGNETSWMGGGSEAWFFSTAKFYSNFSNGPGLMNEISSRTNPTVVPDHSDPNTGIGHGSSSDELSIIAGGTEAIRVSEVATFITVQYFGTLIVPTASAGAAAVGFEGDPDTGYFSPVPDAIATTAGGIEGTRWAEAGGSIIMTDEIDTGLTASVTQTQAGGLVLLSSQNEVSTVATTGDALTAMPVSAGMRLLVINNGANSLQLFPAVGDDFGAGVDTAISIIAGGVGLFVGRDATAWDVLFNADPDDITFPLLAPNGTAGAPSYSFAGETNTGIYYSGSGISMSVIGSQIMRSDDTGLLGPSGSSPTWYLVSDESASNTNPVYAFNNDINSGIGGDGSGTVSIIASGVEYARAINATNQFAVIAGNAAAPGLAFLGDLDTGVYREDTDRLALAAGGVPAVMYQEGFTTGILAASQNDIGLTASVTQTQAGGLVLRSSYNEVSTVATTGDALTLQGPPTLAAVTGKHTVVVNNGANDLQLFPALGDDLGAGVNASITVVAGGICVLLGRDSTNWDVLYNDVPSPGGTTFPILAPDGTAAAPSYSFASDPDTGIYSVAANILGFTASGSLSWVLSTTSFAGSGGLGADIRNTAPSSTVPTLIPRGDDPNTGIGWNAIDQLSLIAGGVEGIRISEDTGNISVDIFGHSEIFHTSIEDDDSAVKINHNAAGFADSHSISIDHVTGALATAEEEAVILANIDANLATGGTISGFSVLAVDPANADLVNALFVGGGIAPIEQLSGTFANADTVLDNAADVTVALSTGGAGNIGIFDADNDTVTVGSAAKFQEIEFILDTVASNPGIQPLFEYSTGVGTWAAFSPTDGTDQMRQNGVIAWLLADIPGWVVGTGSEFLIRITRQRNSLGTTPIADLVQILAGNLYEWDENADLTINSVTVLDSTLADSITVSHDGTDGNVVVVGTDLNFSGVTGVYTFDNPIRLPNASGDATAPAYAFSPATNAGMFHSALGIGIAFTSAEQLRVANNLTEIFSDGGLRIRPNIAASDHIQIEHTLTDVDINVSGAVDFNIAGVGLERLRLSQPNLAMLEKAAAPADEAGVGQFWVRNDTPNTAMFTNDAGVDKSLVNDAVQARRTTVYTLTTAFVDITMDVTDIETDSAVLDHDLATNTDNIIMGQAGTYEVTYDFDVICTAVSGDPIIDMGCRVRLNDAGTGINGSLANPYVFRDGSVGGDNGQFQVHVSNTFIFTAAAADFITLQLDKTELSGSATFNASKICMKVKRLL